MERVDFMALVALQAPDFRTISEFRRRHLAALLALFVQVLKLCERRTPKSSVADAMRTSVVTRNYLQINSRVATRNSSGTDFKSHRSPEAFLGSSTYPPLRGDS